MAFMPVRCVRLSPSLILALVIVLGLQRISDAVSTLDMSPCIPGMTWILRANLHLNAFCFKTLASPLGVRYKESVSTYLNLPSFTHPYSFLQPACAVLPSFSFAYCADSYDPVGCYGIETGDLGRPERSYHLNLTPTEKSPVDSAGTCASELSQSSGFHSRFFVNCFSCFS